MSLQRPCRLLNIKVDKDKVDYFCTIPDTTPPLACFLSHVHSDHLRGLESLKSPFVYCSHVTKQVLPDHMDPLNMTVVDIFPDRCYFD